MLSSVEVTVKEHKWRRVVDSSGDDHAHGFTAEGPEYGLATASLARRGGGRDDELRIVSAIKSLVFLKTTQSGFENFLQNEHTTLPETNERCLSSVLNAEWQYAAETVMQRCDYAALRATVRRRLLEAILGPAATGVYSPSLQATVYEAGCHVLRNASAIAQIFIDTPNVHYIPVAPAGGLLPFEGDLFMPTSDPAGTICCTLARTELDLDHRDAASVHRRVGGAHIRSKL